MIKYDEYGLIVQHRVDDPNYADAGDSCMRTSIAVISFLVSNLKLDAFVFASGKVVRHPFQVPYRYVSNTSRDQLMALLAACYLSNRKSLAKLVTSEYKYFINKDFLGLPHIQWFMRKCAGDNSYSWLGDKSMRADIWFMCKYKPDHELNQLFCVALVLGNEYVKLICYTHPDWRKNLRDYYSGWRGQPELGIAFIKRIEEEL